jgi:DNA polymerase/3'-5' exonuclease PolX
MKRTAKDNFEKTSLEDAQSVADKLIEALKPFCSRVQVSGSIRRMKPEIGDIDLVVIPSELDEFLPKIKEIIDFDYGELKRFSDFMKKDLSISS